MKISSEDWDRAKVKAQRAFVDALKKATPANQYWQLGLFSPEDDRIIARRLRAIDYEPKLPQAGEKEKWLVRKLSEFIWDCRGRAKAGNARIPDAALKYLEWLCRKYRALKTIPFAKGERHGGGYYLLQPLASKSKADADENYRENWLRRQGEASRDFDYKWACELALLGVPEQFTDFFVRPYYILEKETEELRRLVRIYNIHGETTPMLDLDGESLSAPKPLRVWLNRKANVTWGAGERELQALQFDLSAALAHKRVFEVPYFGWHAKSQIWFFDDVAIGDGFEVLPDKDSKIFWHGGKGYKVGDTDHEGETFHHGRPKMHPGQADKEIWPVEEGEDPVQTAVREIGARLWDSLGGPEGFMALGSVCAYAAAPELYHDQSGFPGLWMHGQPGKGKSSMARWLIQIMGIDKESGIPLKSSVTGVKIVLQQYSNLPAWFEESQTTTEKDMLEMMKYAFGREASVKMSFGSKPRVVRTTPIITGVATSSDGQIRQRYPHILVSDKKRLANHFPWFQKERKKFFIIGRYLLRNRKVFVDGVMEALRGWVEDPELEKVEQRTRYVHGVLYAAFVSLSQMLKAHLTSDLAKYRSAVLAHCVASNAQVGDHVDVNLFWSQLLSAFKTGVFGYTKSDLRKLFKATKRGESPHPPDVPFAEGHNPDDCPQCRGPKWPSYSFYIAPQPVLDHLAKQLRAQGREIPLHIQDLGAQMSQQKYWVPPKPGYGRWHKQKFGYGKDSAGSATNCWCVDVDLHDMGYTAVSDPVLRESWEAPGGLSVNREDWVDPRKGDLFALIHSVEPTRDDGGLV